MHRKIGRTAFKKNVMVIIRQNISLSQRKKNGDYLKRAKMTCPTYAPLPCCAENISSLKGGMYGGKVKYLRKIRRKKVAWKCI